MMKIFYLHVIKKFLIIIMFPSQMVMFSYLPLDFIGSLPSSFFNSDNPLCYIVIAPMTITNFVASK